MTLHRNQDWLTTKKLTNTNIVNGKPLQIPHSHTSFNAHIVSAMSHSMPK